MSRSEFRSNNFISKYWKKKTLNKISFNGSGQFQINIEDAFIDVTELDYFNKITNNNRVAQYTVISAIYSFLLKRLTNDFNGGIASGYDQANPLFLSFPTDLKLSFKEYLQKVKNEILETLENEDYEIAEFQYLSLCSNYSLSFNSTSALSCNGILLDVKINESGSMHIKNSYLEGFVKKNIVEYLIYHFKYFIVHLKDNLSANLSEYQLLSQEEKKQLLIDFNDTDVVFPADKTIVDLFENQVSKTPQNIAVEVNGKQITYLELNQKANQFAKYIATEHHISKGDIVGVLLQKSEMGIVSLLAILKIGAVYLPIDANYPVERINYLIKDSGLKLLITTETTTLRVDNCDLISIDSITLGDNNSYNLDTVISAKDLAYIIYTSGSTGLPKGVMVEHQGTINMFLDQIRSFEITETDKIIWFASVSFDASISEILMALISGAALCIPAEDVIKDKELFRVFLKETQASVVTFPPSYLALLSDEDISGLRCIITAGESANPAKAFSITALGIDYYNAYGPTECTVCVSIYKVTKNDFDKSIISIGKPIANTRVYILDENLQVLPVGVSGKIYVSGTGLARGYLNKTALTNEKFISNPFTEGTQLYDTGDLGCWLTNGTIEFLGRKDGQIKLRGFRIELGEIENTILQYSKAIKQVVVDIKEHNNEKTLVAYFVGTNLVDKADLRIFLQNRLPDYMVPGFYVPLEKLPLTPNGKVDKKSLPAISGTDSIRKMYVAPRNKTEEDLVAIWEQVLDVRKIGITDDFFELGGHSLIVGQVINRINQQLGKTVSFKTFFSNATVEKMSTHLKDNNYRSIEKVANSASYPLTASQNRLWILSQLEGGSLAYNMPATVKLTGDIDKKKFEESFALLIERHEILRTYFKTNTAGDVQQYVLPAEEVDFKILQENFTLAENHQDKVQNYLYQRNNEAFDLQKAPLLRVSLLKLKNKEYVFFLSLHHIIGDGWSMELLISEVIKTYNALIQGKNIEFPVLKIQYKDYAVWHNNAIKQEKQQESEQYWLEQFSGELPVLNLPSFKARPLVQTYKGEQRRYEFSEIFLEQLKAFSIQQDVTLFMTLMAGINTLLYTYTGQNDIILGTPIAGREHPDLENQLGLYLNTLAIRTKFNEKDSFADLIVAQKETLLEAYEHQNYPFDALVGKLNLKRDTSRSALFDVMVVLQSQRQLNNLEKDELSNLTVSAYEFKSKTSKLDLSFTFIENEGLDLVIDYNSDIYDAYLIERMFAHFENLITAVMAKPETALHAIEYLTIAEEYQLLKTFSDTAVNYPTDKTIIDLFEEQVARTPHNIAVVFEDKVLTYKQLNEQANQLGHYIRQNNNVQPDDLIGIKLERSEKMIVSIFAILKSGGAYVPIDPGYPQERIEYIEKDSNSKFVIDQQELELFYKQQDQYSAINPKKINSPENLAYVIYTSGTTGNPKGTLLEHKNVVRLFFTDKSLFDFDENDVWTMFHSYSFDFSVWEINGALLFGGKLVVVPKLIAQNTSAFLELLYDQSVTVLNQTPSSFYNLIQYEKIEVKKDYKLRYVIFGGEALNPSLLSDWHKKYPDTRLINMYGITETTVHVTYKEIGANEIALEQSNIGKPIPTLGCYILDPNKNIVSIGVFGELYITGSGLARGYLNRADLTSEKFLPSPFVEGELMYKTGDLGRWLPDGDIEYIGRIDHQIKIRGFRIELGEIETAIAQYSDNIQKVVLEAKEVNREKVLIAYLVANSAIDKSELRYYLQSKLPEYMVPVFYIELEAIPLTSNGKVDRKALPVIKGEDLLQKQYIAPRNAREEKLAEIWKEVLAIEQIGITDNFFELGGHSLLLGQVINRIYKQLGKTVSFKTFFISPTIEGLSKQLQEDIYSPIEQAPDLEFYPLTPSQNRLWVLSQLKGGETIYNMPAAIKLKGIIDTERFNQAFIQLIARHEILRTSFRANENGEIRQFVVAADQVKFKITEKDFSTKTDEEHRIADYLEEKNNEIFDLEQAPLIKASILKLDQDEYLFFLSLHHIIGDGWSIEVLIAEVTRIYNALMQGKEIHLPALRIQYKDYAVWLNNHLQQEKQQKSAQYWLQQFKGELPVLDLPSFKKRPLIQTHNGNNITHQFSSDFLEKVKTFSKEQEVTLFMTLMTAINALLHLYTGQNDIVIGTPVAGREHPDLENQIGLYLNTLAIRTVFEENTNFADLLQKQKKILVEAFEHQNYPFDELVGQLNLKRDSSRSSLFDVLVVLQNQTQLNNFENEKLTSLEIQKYNFSRKSSQFDLSFTFVETKGLDLKIEYNTDIYDAYLMERMFSHFEKLLVALIAQPEVLIQKAAYLNENEKQKILVDFNDTTVIYPIQKTIVDLFEDQVIKTPYNNAVLFEQTTLTYAALNQKANRLAYYLRENYSIKPDDLVGIKLDRSERMIVAILGVLKSGAAYIPIDVNYPQERIAYIEKDSNSKIVIDEALFEAFIEIQEKYSGNNIQKNNKPNSLAYVIYTSGTTGNPKGVMVEHTNVINLISHQTFVFGIAETENILQFSNLSFDASVEQIFLALLNGASLSIPNNETLLNGKKLEEYITAQNITHLHAVPSLLENIESQKFPFLKRVISGGDICPVALADSWNRYCDFYNEYGPTETSVTAIELLYNPVENFSIGRPISNTQVYILNQALQPVAIGVTGRIFISGAGVTRGYLNKPELTADKFIANPYSKDSLMYDTGDLGRWLPDGNIEFLGRKDQQVKLRGYRIELGEIETVIAQFSADIKQVIVELKEINSDTFLVAYLVSNAIVDSLQLKHFLQGKLPNYMIPGFYVILDNFPLTPNGKIDRKALPDLSGNNIIKKEYVGARNETEEKLIEIWQEVLAVDAIGVQDNFFELGGHSLKAMKLISLIYKEFEIKVSINDLFQNIVLEDQALLIENIYAAYNPEINQDENDIDVEIFSI